MRQLARQPEAFERPAASAIRDLGGPVAAMQRSLADRLAADPVGLLPVAPDGILERSLTQASRWAGPVALGLGYLVTARLLLG